MSCHSLTFTTMLTYYPPSQLFCVTADNTSNSDTACDSIERILYCRRIYSFNATEHRLPCLAHVLNLAITAAMSTITGITNVETATAIWEFDPALPCNCVLGDSLNVVSAICTLAIKIQASGQCIAYFKCLQTECGFSTPLKIPLQSNVRWGTADGMLGCLYELRQVRSSGLVSYDVFTVCHRRSIFLLALQMSCLVPLPPSVTQDLPSRTSHGRHSHSNQQTGNV